MPNMDSDGLLTTKEAAALFKLSPRTLERLTAKGELPSVKIGGARRYRLRTLLAWAERLEEDGGTQEARKPTPSRQEPPSPAPPGAGDTTPGLTCPACGHIGPLPGSQVRPGDVLRCSRCGHARRAA